MSYKNGIKQFEKILNQSQNQEKKSASSSCAEKFAQRNATFDVLCNCLCKKILLCALESETGVKLRTYRAYFACYRAALSGTAVLQTFLRLFAGLVPEHQSKGAQRSIQVIGCSVCKRADGAAQILSTLPHVVQKQGRVGCPHSKQACWPGGGTGGFFYKCVSPWEKGKFFICLFTFDSSASFQCTNVKFATFGSSTFFLYLKEIMGL